MCGIIGIVAKKSTETKKQAASMMACLAHRGPDADGIAEFDDCTLGHRRLSIIDLSTGAQPMCTADDSIAVTFNGEIYGYKDIKKELKNYPFRTNSDTETILALYETYGERFVEKLPGMFAFAIWDSKNNMLIAARDRFGEKPFYYAYGPHGEFIFASEIKAIIASGLVRPVLNKEAVAHYLKRLYVHPTQTIYSNIHTLPPAHMLTFKDGKLEVSRYWKLPETNTKITLDEALPKFKTLLTDAVRKQLIADVPVGAFLSGGLDSTTIVALASEELAKQHMKLQTFAFGFEGSKNELSFAKKAAGAFKTDHRELHDHEYNIADLIAKMATIYDEPFADSSNIPTYLISKKTREYSTVVLTGDAGDELLGGYGWYKSLISMQEQAGSTSIPGKLLLMKTAARLAMRMNLKNKVSIISSARGYEYQKRYASMLEAHRASNVYFKDNEIKDLGLDAQAPILPPSWQTTNTPDDAMKDDIEDYMPGDILVKIDRASMASSLELRAPFLDVPFAEFAISLPYTLKVDSAEDKMILRRAFEEIWPEEIRRRGKQGFGAPVKIWLKKPEVTKLVDTYLNDRSKKLFSLISFDQSRSYVKEGAYKTWILLVLSIWMETHEFDM